MQNNIKIATLVGAASALAITVPATALPGPAQGGHHPPKAHKCVAHHVAYVESGVVDKATLSTLAKNADGTWSGTLVIDVKRANHRARADRGTTVTYMFTSAKLRVRFIHGTSGFTAGERVKLIGKLAAVGKGCPALDPAPAPAFRMLVVHPASS